MESRARSGAAAANHSREHGEILGPSLELALKTCTEQLKVLRTSETASAPSFAGEERALQLSLAAIVAQLRSVREAAGGRRDAAFADVLQKALHLLPTGDVVRLTGASRPLRACIAGDAGASLLVPHLDAVPPWPHQWGRFLAEVVRLGSVRSLALPAAATSYLLAEHSEGLCVVERLALPKGLSDFDMIPRLGSLRALVVDLCDAERAVIDRLAEALLMLQNPLASLQLITLDPELALPLLEAILPQGLTECLAFDRCTLLDTAVESVCRAIISAPLTLCISAPLTAVRFEDCEISDASEQHLLTTLEHCDGRCVVTIEGGTTRNVGTGRLGGEEAFPEPPKKVEEVVSHHCGSAAEVGVAEWHEVEDPFSETSGLLPESDSSTGVSRSRFGFALDVTCTESGYLGQLD